MTDKEVIQKVLKLLMEILQELVAGDCDTQPNLSNIALEIEEIAEKHRNG